MPTVLTKSLYGSVHKKKNQKHVRVSFISISTFGIPNQILQTLTNSGWRKGKAVRRQCWCENRLCREREREREREAQGNNPKTQNMHGSLFLYRTVQPQETKPARVNIAVLVPKLYTAWSWIDDFLACMQAPTTTNAGNIFSNWGKEGLRMSPPLGMTLIEQREIQCFWDLHPTFQSSALSSNCFMWMCALPFSDLFSKQGYNFMKKLIPQK